MKLDSRILKGKKYLDCFDVDIAKQFIGKKGYFSHYVDNYADLKNTVLGTLGSTGDTFHESFCCTEETFDNYYYEFFLPAEWVKQPEKKYRPYSIKDFRKAFVIGKKFDVFIILRDKHNPDDIYTLRYNGSVRKGQFEYICLGTKIFSFKSLFESCEIMINGEWQPFGVEE